MDRLARRFAACADDNRAALVTFVTAGDPDLDRGPSILAALVAGGADIIELGMPFTDPMADGPAIQAGNIRSLTSGTTLRAVLAMVRAFRATDDSTPLILMGYFNPILAYGMHNVRLATPTTDARRLPAVLSGASGFLYYVAVAGVTGTASAADADIASAVARLKSHTALPVAVGFGIKTHAQAAAVGLHADGVVVGSALVSLIGAAAEARANDLPEQVEAFVRGLADAVRTAREPLSLAREPRAGAAA